MVNKNRRDLGKTYIRTKSGRIVEAPVEEGGEFFIDPATGKMFLRTKSGNLKEIPSDGVEVIKDPTTGKVYMKTQSGRLIEIQGDVDMYIDPLTGSTITTVV